MRASGLGSGDASADVASLIARLRARQRLRVEGGAQDGGTGATRRPRSTPLRSSDAACAAPTPQAALLIAILDALRLSKNASWFEEHVDFVSMQAVLFNGAAKSWWAQTTTLVRLQSRLVD